MRKKPRQKKKALIALSGGIDSAVSAYLLLRKGYQVEAAFMKNWSSTAGLLKNECPWLVDRQDALRVAAFLKIPLHTLDFEKEYRDTVMRYFFKEYEAGRTPNPDVMCNKEIKFKLLYDWATNKRFDYLATGHYAQIRHTPKILGREGKAYRLLRSRDEYKDQTYFIYNIKPDQLAHVLFPIGGMKKTAVRALARKLGLPNAEKKESMGLCFVGKIRLKDFLEQKLKIKPGAVIDQHGNTIGSHPGLHYYTIGQRQGINVGATGPYYVTKKDLKKKTLHVTNNPEDTDLMTQEVGLHSLNWLDKNLKSQISNLKFSGRYRHQGELVPLRITSAGQTNYRVKFQKPQKAVASGQSLVFYKDKVCVGGGIIA